MACKVESSHFQTLSSTMIIVQNYRLSDWINIFNGYQPLED